MSLMLLYPEIIYMIYPLLKKAQNNQYNLRMWTNFLEIKLLWINVD